MAKERYRLQALLEVRKKLKRKAEGNLARSIKRLNEEKERLAKLEEEKEGLIIKWKDARKKMVEEMNFGAMAGKGKVHTNYLKKLEELQEEKDQEIEEQELQVEEAENGVALARREYIDACRSLQIMEKHRELWEKKIKQEISRKEAKEMDELGQTIHQLRKWRGEKPLFEEL